MDLSAARRLVEADSYTYACFTSAGGLGWASMIPIPGDDHKGSFRALAAYYLKEYGLSVDQSCKDVSRLRFVSYDPALYLNEQAATFEEAVEEPAKPVKTGPLLPHPVRNTPYNDDHGRRALELACDWVRTVPDGQKHNTLNKMAYLCGGYVAAGFLSEADARAELRAAIGCREVTNAKNAWKTIDDGLTAGQQKPVLPPALQRIVRQKQRSETPCQTIVHELSASTGVPADRLEQIRGQCTVA